MPTYFTLPLRTALSIEHMPQDPGVVGPTPLTIGWTGKQSHYTLQYELADLAVTPGVPDPTVDPPVDPGPGDPVIVNPPTGPGPVVPGPGSGVPTPTPTPPSGTVRPAAAPRLAIGSRVTPANFRSKGIRIRVTLSETAKIEVVATAKVKKRLSRRRTQTVKRTITRKRSVTLKQGTTALRITPSSAGRSTVGTRSRVRATVTLTARFPDGRRVTINRAVLIARSTKA